MKNLWRGELRKRYAKEHASFRFFDEGEFDDSQVLPTVYEITGRRPRAFEQWAMAHVDAFR